MGVDSIPERIHSSVKVTVRRVDGVKEVVHRGRVRPGHRVAHLVESHVLGVGEGHGITEVQVGFPTDSRVGSRSEPTAVDAVEDGCRSVGSIVVVDVEKAVEIRLGVGVSRELDDAVAVSLDEFDLFGDIIPNFCQFLYCARISCRCRLTWPEDKQV